MSNVDTSWSAKLERRRAFCAAFVRQHHPGMANAAQIGVTPLKPLDGPRVNHHHISAFDWWLHTNDSMSALGGTYIGYLFKHRNLLNHAWIIGRSDQEPWAMISEPYSQGDDTPEQIAELRIELGEVGVELIEYPAEQSTHSPGPGIHVLVAHIIDNMELMGAVARHIAERCERRWPAARSRIPDQLTEVRNE